MGTKVLGSGIHNEDKTEGGLVNVIESLCLLQFHV